MALAVLCMCVSDPSRGRGVRLTGRMTNASTSVPSSKELICRLGCLTQTLHVWNVCLHWGGFGVNVGIWHTWSVWVRFPPQKIDPPKHMYLGPRHLGCFMDTLRHPNGPAALVYPCMAGSASNPYWSRGLGLCTWSGSHKRSVW